jgi:hypothetical protein
MNQKDPESEEGIEDEESYVKDECGPDCGCH